MLDKTAYAKNTCENCDSFMLPNSEMNEIDHLTLALNKLAKLEAREQNKKYLFVSIATVVINLISIVVNVLTRNN